MNKQMSSEELKQHVIGFLKEHKDAALATCMNNVPRCSPVQYFLGDNMTMYILSAGGEKFKAIDKNKNVCLLVNTEYLTYRKIKGIQVFGTAETSESNSSLLIEAKRFSPEPYIIESKSAELKVIKITPEEIVYLDALETGDRTKQVLKLKENTVELKEDRELAIF